MERLGLHHLYRAMGWLGEELADDQQADPTPFAPRCLKDVMKEELFARRRDLFSRLALVLVDTTNLYFEGAGVRLHRRASNLRSGGVGSPPVAKSKRRFLFSNVASH